VAGGLLRQRHAQSERRSTQAQLVAIDGAVECGRGLRTRAQILLENANRDITEQRQRGKEFQLHFFVVEAEGAVPGTPGADQDDGAAVELVQLPQIQVAELVQLLQGGKEGAADAVGEVAVGLEDIGEFKTLIVDAGKLKAPGADELVGFLKKRCVAEVSDNVGVSRDGAQADADLGGASRRNVGRRRTRVGQSA